MKLAGIGVALMSCALCLLVSVGSSAQEVSLDMTRIWVTNVTRDSMTVDNIAVDGLGEKVIAVLTWDPSSLSFVPTQSWIRPTLDGTYQAVGFRQMFSNGHVVTEENYTDYWGRLTLKGNNYILAGYIMGENVNDSGTLDVRFVTGDTAYFHQVGSKETLDGTMILIGESVSFYTTSRRASNGLVFDMLETYLKMAL